MEYWKDGSEFAGRPPQVPGAFSHGATLGELEENIPDARRMMLDGRDAGLGERLVETKEIEVPVRDGAIRFANWKTLELFGSKPASGEWDR